MRDMRGGCIRPLGLQSISKLTAVKRALLKQECQSLNHQISPSFCTQLYRWASFSLPLLRAIGPSSAYAREILSYGVRGRHASVVILCPAHRRQNPMPAITRTTERGRRPTNQRAGPEQNRDASAACRVSGGYDRLRPVHRKPAGAMSVFSLLIDFRHPYSPSPAAAIPAFRFTGSLRIGGTNDPTAAISDS